MEPSVAISSETRPFLPSAAMRTCSSARKIGRGGDLGEELALRALRGQRSGVRSSCDSADLMSSSGLCRGPMLAARVASKWQLGPRDQAADDTLDGSPTCAAKTSVTPLSGPGGLVDERLEACGVLDGEIGQHLAVDLDAGLVEAVDKSAVGQPVLAHGRVDALDPQRAEACASSACGRDRRTASPSRPPAWRRGSCSCAGRSSPWRPSGLSCAWRGR